MLERVVAINRRKERQAQSIQAVKREEKYQGQKTVIHPTLILN